MKTDLVAFLLLAQAPDDRHAFLHMEGGVGSHVCQSTKEFAGSCACHKFKIIDLPVAGSQSRHRIRHVHSRPDATRDRGWPPVAGAVGALPSHLQILFSSDAFPAGGPNDGIAADNMADQVARCSGIIAR